MCYLLDIKLIINKLKNKKMKKTIEKMVLISGVAVPLSKAEGRMKALAFGRWLKAQLAEDEARQEEEWRKKGCNHSEIRTLRHRNRISEMENMGLGQIKRIVRVQRSA